MEEVMKDMKRSWFCKDCGWSFDEEVGLFRSKGDEGISTCYCPNCKARTQFDWKIIENTDPTEQLEVGSGYCNYCQEIKPAEIMNYNFENYLYPVCDYCYEAGKDEVLDEFDADEIKNKMDLAKSDITRLGQFDADDLQYIQFALDVKKMIDDGRIGIQYSGHDCGNLWVTLGDEKAFEIASKIIG